MRKINKQQWDQPKWRGKILLAHSKQCSLAWYAKMNSTDFVFGGYVGGLFKISLSWLGKSGLVLVHLLNGMHADQRGNMETEHDHFTI